MLYLRLHIVLPYVATLELRNIQYTFEERICDPQDDEAVTTEHRDLYIHVENM
jgi:hypothetical protein